MKVLIIAVFAFFGALLVPGMFFPSFHKVAFHFGGIGFTWSLIMASVTGVSALGLSAK